MPGQSQMIRLAGALAVTTAALLAGLTSSLSRIRFTHSSIGFHLETDETVSRHVPATIGWRSWGIRLQQGWPSGYFLYEWRKHSDAAEGFAKVQNRLFRNDGNGVFTDVTDQ